MGRHAPSLPAAFIRRPHASPSWWDPILTLPCWGMFFPLGDRSPSSQVELARPVLITRGRNAVHGGASCRLAAKYYIWKLWPSKADEEDPPILPDLPRLILHAQWLTFGTWGTLALQVSQTYGSLLCVTSIFVLHPCFPERPARSPSVAVMSSSGLNRLEPGRRHVRRTRFLHGVAITWRA